MRRVFPLEAYVILWIFGIAFGVVEGAVVVYLRALNAIEGGSLFPLVEFFVGGQGLLVVELVREGATLALLLLVAWLATEVGFYRLLAFLLVFGVWDLAYYAALRVFLGWPPSLFTYDVLFLIPTVWVAPVICPVLVSLTLIGLTSVYFLVARSRLVEGPPLWQWPLLAAGVGLMLYAFLNNAPYYLAGGEPPRFSWGWFFSGYVLATVTAVSFLVNYSRRSRRRFG